MIIRTANDDEKVSQCFWVRHHSPTALRPKVPTFGESGYVTGFVWGWEGKACIPQLRIEVKETFRHLLKDMCVVRGPDAASSGLSGSSCSTSGAVMRRGSR